eukprot:1925410-Rhodomonas_salina.3
MAAAFRSERENGGVVQISAGKGESPLQDFMAYSITQVGARSNALRRVSVHFAPERLLISRRSARGHVGSVWA